MSGTSVVTVKQTLLAAIQTALTGTGVQTAYAWPGGTEERELVYLGTAEFEQTYRTFAGGGRVSREEDVTVAVHIAVTKLGVTFEETEERAVEIGTLLEHSLAANPTQSGAALNFQIAGGGLGGFTEDEFTTSVLSYEVSATSHLT